MDDPTLAALAAKIAELEAVDPGRGRRPRAANAPGVDAIDAVDGGAGATRPLISGAGSEAPPLPIRDVDAPRGPSLIDASGQQAHDEALGVGPDGRPLDAGEEGASRGRPSRKQQAELAFSEAPPHQRALELAYVYVAKRERTSVQLQQHLAGRGCGHQQIAAALTELRRHGFVDDARYAKLYAEDKRRLQGWGARRIRTQLARDGIPRDLLDQLFADDEAQLDAPSEFDVALALLQRKQPPLDDPKAKQRAAAMLARRGLASSTVFAALRAYERGDDQ